MTVWSALPAMFVGRLREPFPRTNGIFGEMAQRLSPTLPLSRKPPTGRPALPIAPKVQAAPVKDR